jgi:hypothetical protein
MGLTARSDALEQKYDANFNVVFDAARQLMISPDWFHRRHRSAQAVKSQPDNSRLPFAFFPSSARFWLVAFLMAAYTAGYAWSAPTADTADELLRAYEIRHGIAYPLEGPFLGGALHFGPMWFYLTALPLWISHSWLAVALFIGFICSLKFPLAYLCGRKLIDADFGLLWAAAMFVPGWASLEQLVFLNPNGVAAAALLVLAVSLRGLEKRIGWPTFTALGLALAVAIHVHPTSAPVFILVVLVLWLHYRRSQRLLGPLVAIVAGFLVPFIPYVVSQIRGGFADWGSATAYMSGQVVPTNIVNVPAVIVSYLLAGPAVVAEYLMRWSPDRAAMLGVVMAAAASTSVAGYFHPLSRQRLLLFFAALLVFAAWVACMRPTTPLQFTWVLGPVVAGLVAIGLWSLGRMPALRPLVWGIVAASVVFNAFAIRAMALTVWDGEGHLPSLELDIKNTLPHTIFRDVWFPALSHGELGQLLCEAGEVSLHGHLAYIADKDLGLDALFACNDRSRLSLVASDAPNHYFGMTRIFWRALGGAPECWVGSLGLTRQITPLLDRKPLPLADGSTYMPRQIARNPPETTILSVSAPSRAGVMLTNVLDGYEHFQIVSVEAAGQLVSPLAENDFSSLFVAPPGGPHVVQWRFTVKATNPQAIDVVSVDAVPGTAAGGAPASKQPSATCKRVH